MNKTVLPSELNPDPDGPLYVAQKKIYPQRVSGTFRRIKWILMAVCLGIYYFLPFVRWNRGPGLPDQAVLLDLANNRFYFFFIELWPQEVYYFTGLLIIAAIVLFLMNSLGGRVWCGYLCPQTVWTDLFYAVERAVEGDRVLWSQSLGTAEDVCRRRRRDYYVNYRLTLPDAATLPPGTYRLQIQQRDAYAGAEATGEITLTIAEASNG